MAETNIEWTDYTWNPWRGCTKVSPGCANCYAEAMSARNPTVLGEWGPEGTRVVAVESYWRLPLKWDREAARAGVRRKVFCASLADVFEGPATMPTEAWPKVQEARRRMFGSFEDAGPGLIERTPNLDWLLLTKRPENVDRVLSQLGIPGWWDWIAKSSRNAWLGVSVEDQPRADQRIPRLIATPAAVRFLSCEPLLEDLGDINLDGIHWVIVGGESGPDARPCDVEWVRSLVRQCAASGTACFVKQLGSEPAFDPKVESGSFHHGRDGLFIKRLRDRKGGDPAEWPEDLRVRQFPEVVRG